MEISVISGARTHTITHVGQRRRPLHYRGQLKFTVQKMFLK